MTTAIAFLAYYTATVLAILAVVAVNDWLHDRRQARLDAARELARESVDLSLECPGLRLVTEERCQIIYAADRFTARGARPESAA